MAGESRGKDGWKGIKRVSSDSDALIQGRTRHADTKRDEPKIQALQKKRRIRTNTAELEFIMPPSTISLVPLGVECRFDTITIPDNVVMDYINENQSITDVSGHTADALLRQIAGLTAIAQNRSLEAHDTLTTIKRLHEIDIMAKEKEISSLHERLEWVMKEAKTGDPNVKHEDAVLSRPKDGVLDEKTGFTSESEDQTNTTTSSSDVDIPLISLLHRSRDNDDQSGKSQFPYRSTDVVAHFKNYTACSEKSLDIIYGMPRERDLIDENSLTKGLLNCQHPRNNIVHYYLTRFVKITTFLQISLRQTLLQTYLMCSASKSLCI